MSEPVSSVMREVEDDLRQQQMHDFWRENRLWIAATVVLAIVATGAVAFWRGHTTDKNMDATAQMIAALRDNTRLETLAADPAALDRPAHVALVRLNAAARALNAGDTAKVLALYDALAKDRSADPVLRDLGVLSAASLRLDSAPAAELEQQLTPLAREGEPWRFSALELLGLLAAREGNMKDAAARMAEISGSAEAPQDARTRAFTLRELYQADASMQATKSK